ncbi:MAG: enoyl-CoA hydratase-related protein, partial [Rhizobiaceae bacterium]
FNPLVRRMRQTRLPIVAAINGPCAGAAVGIALAADIVVAARSAYLYEPFVGIALVPDAGNTLFLTRIMGRVRAAGMMLLGDRISAEEAASWGLVWRVFDDAELAGETDRIAAKLASLPPGAAAATKRLIAHAADFGQDAQLDLERDLQGDAGRSPEMKAAVAEFFARRRAG